MTCPKCLYLRKSPCHEEATKCCLVEPASVYCRVFQGNSLGGTNTRAGEGQLLKDTSDTIVCEEMLAARNDGNENGGQGESSLLRLLFVMPG